MIRGQVSANKEAVIPLQLRGAQGQIETILILGQFDGSLRNLYGVAADVPTYPFPE